MFSLNAYTQENLSEDKVDWKKDKKTPSSRMVKCIKQANRKFGLNKQTKEKKIKLNNEIRNQKRRYVKKCSMDDLIKSQNELNH